MPVNDEFLRDYFKDCEEQMRWRANVEYRLLQFLLIFYPLIVTALSTLYSSAIDKTAYLSLSIAASLFILLTSLFVTRKVYDEHNTYADVGRIVQKIWLYFRLFERGAYLQDESILAETLLDTKKGYGQGQGYKRTLYIIWTITIVIAGLIIALGILRLSSVSPSVS